MKVLPSPMLEPSIGLVIRISGGSLPARASIGPRSLISPPTGENRPPSRGMPPQFKPNHVAAVVPLPLNTGLPLSPPWES